jgi:hypothetical protein
LAAGSEVVLGSQSKVPSSLWSILGSRRVRLLLIWD